MNEHLYTNFRSTKRSFAATLAPNHFQRGQLFKPVAFQEMLGSKPLIFFQFVGDPRRDDTPLRDSKRVQLSIIYYFMSIQYMVLGFEPTTFET